MNCISLLTFTVSNVEVDHIFRICPLYTYGEGFAGMKCESHEAACCWRRVEPQETRVDLELE